jgi:hypothetical protein
VKSGLFDFITTIVCGKAVPFSGGKGSCGMDDCIEYSICWDRLERSLTCFDKLYNPIVYKSTKYNAVNFLLEFYP